MKNMSLAAAAVSLGAAACIADVALMVAPSGGSAAVVPATSTASADAPDSPAGTPVADLNDGTYTGAVISTAKGDVQVSMTVARGKITEVTAVKYPNDNPRSQSISGEAVATLSAEAIDAQGADIQMVSGATETSTGFIGSLQDALNQAQ